MFDKFNISFCQIENEIFHSTFLFSPIVCKTKNVTLITDDMVLAFQIKVTIRHVVFNAK